MIYNMVVSIVSGFFCAYALAVLIHGMVFAIGVWIILTKKEIYWGKFQDVLFEASNMM